jgi:hypothetical protein
MSLPPKLSYEDNAAGMVSSSEPATAPTITPSASKAKSKAKSKVKPKSATKPKSEASKTSSRNAAKEIPSTSNELLETTVLENGLAVTEMGFILGISGSVEEAERQVYEHMQGLHEGRDPYRLASQSYLVRGESVPWYVCEMCKDEEEGMHTKS